MICKEWIFKNDPFRLLAIAFERVFPGVEYIAHIYPEMKDKKGNKVFGDTFFCKDGKIEIFIDAGLSIMDAIEVFAHELAHAGAGLKSDHGPVWEKAFDDIFSEYNKVAEEILGEGYC